MRSRAHFIAAFCGAACYSAAASSPSESPARPALASGTRATISTTHAPPLASAPSPTTVAAQKAAPLPARAAPISNDIALPVAAQPANETPARCPPEMAFIERTSGKFCIDRWEASLVERKPDGALSAWPGNRRVERGLDLIAVSAGGQKPQAYISGAEAARACERAAKRLCGLDEWARACRGPHAHTYPYGDRREPERCNDRERPLEQHPVVALFERFAPPGADRSEMWQQRWMNDPRLYDQPHAVQPTGSKPGCRSDYGVFDMVGNLHEWIADPEGTFVGGFFMDTVQNGEGCGYRTRAHDMKYHDYSTGFRCCKDADE